jgi:hypothetical protein
MTEAIAEPVGYVDCTPRLSPETYLDILDMNMTCLRKEFGPGWTRTKKIGGTYTDDQLHRAVDARYAFIKHWYDLLEADLHLLDHISKVRRYDRHHLPGVVISLRIAPKLAHPWRISLLIKGKPLQAIPKDDLEAEVTRLFLDKKNSIEDVKKQVEYYLRGQGYATLEVQEIINIEV